MKNKYQEKQQTRIIRYKEIAQKLKTQAEALAERSDQLSEHFFGGQPILVGHHSEKKARRVQGMMHHKMRKSFQAKEKAEQYERKAQAVENNTAISSDDPDVKEKLEGKIKNLTFTQELWKQVNRICRKKDWNKESKIAMIKQLGYDTKEAVEFVTDGGVADYRLKNNSANLSATKKRLEKILLNEKIGDYSEEVRGVKLEVNQEFNRVMILFPVIPPDHVRSDLKRSGFHWSPTNGVWMRKISNEAIRQGKRLMGVFLEWY